jgi:hypothetical protein
MAIERFARKFSLNPPPRGKQFRAEFAKARAADRRATRKLETALDACASAPSGADAEATGPPVNPLELMRAWSSPGMLNLRRDLDPRAEETLHARLEALMAGRLSQQAWAKTLSVILDARLRREHVYSQRRPDESLASNGLSVDACGIRRSTWKQQAVQVELALATQF